MRVVRGMAMNPQHARRRAAKYDDTLCGTRPGRRRNLTLPVGLITMHRDPGGYVVGR